MSGYPDTQYINEIVDRAFEVISDFAYRYQGTTNQFLGDGVMRCSGRRSWTQDLRIGLTTRRRGAVWLLQRAPASAH
jgi:hypothetical protein